MALHLFSLTEAAARADADGEDHAVFFTTIFHRSRRRLIFLVGAAHDDLERVVLFLWALSPLDDLATFGLAATMVPCDHYGALRGSLHSG